MTSVSDRPDSLPRADPGSSAYWLIVGGGDSAPRIFTMEMPDGERALVVFGFQEEGEMYLRSQGDLGFGRWRLRHSGVGEVLSVLWTLCAGVMYVVMDPLPENLPQRLGGATLIMGRQEFMDFLMGRRPSE